MCFLQYGTYFLRFEAINENYKPIFAKRFYRNRFFKSKNIWQFYSSKYFTTANCPPSYLMKSKCKKGGLITNHLFYEYLINFILQRNRLFGKLQ